MLKRQRERCEAPAQALGRTETYRMEGVTDRAMLGAGGGVAGRAVSHQGGYCKADEQGEETGA